MGSRESLVARIMRRYGARRVRPDVYVIDAQSVAELAQDRAAAWKQPSKETQDFVTSVAGKEYIWTPARLYEVAIAQLGPLEEGKYQETVDRMRQLAQVKGVAHPLMVIDLLFNEKGTEQSGLNEYTYPITEREWDQFARDAQTMTRQLPHAYMVDGDIYAAPI